MLHPYSQRAIVQNYAISTKLVGCGCHCGYCHLFNACAIIRWLHTTKSNTGGVQIVFAATREQGPSHSRVQQQRQPRLRRPCMGARVLDVRTDRVQARDQNAT